MPFRPMKSMFNQTLFISDIDGTLLKTGQPPRDAVLKAIAQFQKNGGTFCICTGRGLPAVRDVLPLIPGCRLGILCGGASIYDFENRMSLVSHTMDSSVVPGLQMLMAQEASISVTVSTVEKIYRIRDNGILLAKGVQEDRMAPQGTLEPRQGLTKVLFTCDDPTLLERTVKGLFSPEHFELHRASTHFYEMTAAGVNKARGVEELNALLGNRRVFSAGDAPSDIPMAEVSELFFAPETAMASVKEKAWKIIPAPEKAGLAQAFEYLRCYLEGEAADRRDTEPHFRQGGSNID